MAQKVGEGRTDACSGPRFHMLSRYTASVPCFDRCRVCCKRLVSCFVCFRAPKLREHAEYGAKKFDRHFQFEIGSCQVGQQNRFLRRLVYVNGTLLPIESLVKVAVAKKGVALGLVNTCLLASRCEYADLFFQPVRLFLSFGCLVCPSGLSRGQLLLD